MPVVKYRKKPVVIETLLWNGQNLGEVLEFCGKELATKHDYEPLLVFNTEEEQWIGVPVGNSIAKGVLGELYPIAPEVLKASFDPFVETTELWREACARAHRYDLV